MDTETISPEELRDAASRMLGDMVERRAPYEDGKSADRAGLYGAMAEQGWLLLTIPAEKDGLGQSLAALAPIYEELGKAVAPVALAPTLATLELLAAQPTEAFGNLADTIATGEAKVTVATSSAGLTLAPTGAQASLSGRLEGLLADEGTTHLLVLADNGQAWLADLAGAGITVEQVDSWDRSRILLDITLDKAAADAALATIDAQALDRVRAHLALALAWDGVGGTDTSLEETLEYLRTRKQFDRAIGSFQALKHRAADHKVNLEVARAAAGNATAAFVAGHEDALPLAGRARLLAEHAYRTMAEDSVQLHGGIGFTWESDCHLLLKRAILNELLYGKANERRDAIAPGVIATMAKAMA